MAHESQKVNARKQSFLSSPKMPTSSEFCKKLFFALLEFSYGLEIVDCMFADNTLKWRKVLMLR